MRRRRIEADDDFRIRPDVLEAAIYEDRAAGWLPIAVVATVGTTSTTSVDPVDTRSQMKSARIFLRIFPILVGSLPRVRCPRQLALRMW